MTARTNVQVKIKWALRWGALLVPLVLCGLLLTATTSSQQESDSTRRLWDKQFEEARAKARGQTVVKPSATNTKPQTATQPKPSPGATKPAASPVETADDELIGITFWRLRPATSDNSGQPRLSVEQRGVGVRPYRLERADTETPFREGEMVRFSIETTRANNRYLYVIDREVYADKTMGDPYLIFPTRATPRGENVIAAGKLVYVPAQGDAVPYFTLQRKRPDHVGEMLTLILSPEPLPLAELPASGAPLKLDAALVKQWEQQWGSPTERREARGGAGKEWTKAEQEAERGQGVLAQGDPLPQTIHRIKAKPSGRVLMTLPMMIAESAIQSSKPELVLQTGHTMPVKAVALSGDGKIFVSSGFDCTIKVWDVVKGKELRTLSGLDYPGPFVLSNDGRILFAGDLGCIKVWDVATGKLQRKLSGDMVAVTTVALSDDGKTLFSDSNNGTIKVWDVTTGKELRTLAENSGTTVIALSGDGKALISVNRDKTIKIWDIVTGRKMLTLIGHSDGINCIALSSDGKTLISGSDDKTIKIWDIATGKLLRTLSGNNRQITAVALSSDGKNLFSGDLYDDFDNDKSIKVWDVASGQLLRTLRGHNSGVRAIALSRDGKTLVSGGNDFGVKIWNATTGQLLHALSGHVGSVGSVALSGNDRMLFSSDNNTIKTWDLMVGQSLYTLTHSQRIKAIAVSGDGKTLVSSSQDGAIKVWDITTGTLQRTLPQRNHDASTMALSGDGKTLICTGYVAPVVRGNAVTYQDVAIEVWNTATGQLLRKLAGHKGEVNAVVLSSDGKTLFSGSDTSSDNTSSGCPDCIKIWDLGTGRLQRMLTGMNAEETKTLVLSGDSKILFSGGGNEGTIKAWDIATGQQLRTLRGHSGEVNTLALSSDGKTLISGSYDRTIKVWDAVTGRELHALTGHSNTINRVTLSSDGKIIVSGGEDAKIKFWDTASGQELASIVSLSRNDWLTAWKTNSRLQGKAIDAIPLSSNDWVVVGPQGRFDTNNLEEIKGLHWVLPDDPFKPLPLEIFMRDYYEPKLLPRILAGEYFKPLRSFSDLNRVQPQVSITKIEAQQGYADAISVTVEVANIAGEQKRGNETVKLQSGVYDLRLFRDSQLVGYAPEQDGPIKLESGKATITFKDIKLPRRADLKQVEFSAYAFNVDRVKSETARKTYVLPRPLPAVKGRAYVIAVGVNAYENAALDLNYAANDARRLQGVVSEKLKATGEYEEVVPITLLSDYEGKGEQRKIIAEQATKGNVKLVLDLLAGRQVDPARLAGIANADKLRQARPEDLVIISFASHGYADEAGRFYFVTYDTGAGGGREITPALLQKSISSDELSRWLRDVDAGELVMIVDACQSAAAVEGEGFKPGPMGSRGLGQLAYDKGMRILAATQADNAALEHTLIRQGLLTYALVRDGIELGRADFKPEDKTITLGEWLEYARDRVPQLFAEIRSGQVRSGGPAAADMPKVILLPQKNAQPNQAGATRLFLQGKPIGASGNLTLAEEQIQQPALFDYARKRRDVLLLRK